MLRFTDKLILIPFWLISLIPLRVLYGLSYFLYALAYHVIGYRKKVTLTNLRNSFPNKSEGEICDIAKRFYLHLCDVFIESIYLLSATEKQMKRRFRLMDNPLVTENYQNGKDMIMATNHYGNWEWGSIFPKLLPYKALAVYRPLSNQFFDRFYKYLRGKFGCKPIPMKQTLREIIEHKRNNIRFGIYLLGDQRPSEEDLGFWTTFLNQDTPMITGIEKIAQRFDIPVFFMHVSKPRRGYYEIDLKPISLNPSTEEEYCITQKYATYLEEMISEAPELWLWTHKRWKYKRS